jgi:hypothetical protein
MKILTDELDKLKQKQTTYDITIFDEEYLRDFNTPYIEFFINHTNIHYIITETNFSKHDTNTTINTNTKTVETLNKTQSDVIIRNINKLIEDIVSIITTHCVITSKIIFRYDYQPIITKKDITYIVKKYNIPNIKSVNLYTEFMENSYTILENLYLITHINKPIFDEQDNYFLDFIMNRKTYFDNKKEIIEFILYVIRKLNINGNCIIKMIYAPYDESYYKLIMLLINMFKTVNIVYSKWASTTDIVFFVLNNKISKLEELFIDTITIDDNIDNINIKGKLLKYASQILKINNKNISIDKQLFILKNINYKLYLSLKNKVIEKIINYN